MRSCGFLLASAVLILESFAASGQTTAGTSARMVVPVMAQTSSFGSEVTVYNPNAATITVNPVFYDARNTASPGAEACTPLSVGANVSKAFTLAGQCALPAGSNFGLLVLTETTGTQRFYGYARTQTPQGIGFSTEGFPIENFNDQIQHATGLKRVAASAGLPAYQTNCFVATLADAVSYELRLFDGGTGLQLGWTLSGTLGAFQQFRYLDVFAATGAAGGDRTNVRAQFTNVTGNNKKLIGFCTVQENTSFSADFRIAKSYGGMPQNAFVQGGNGFGTTAMLGTTDNQPLTLLVNGHPTLRLSAPLPTNPVITDAVDVVNGSPSNAITGDAVGATIAGGGFVRGDDNVSFGNIVGGDFGTVVGGDGNTVTDEGGTIAGGEGNRRGFSRRSQAGPAILRAAGTRRLREGFLTPPAVTTRLSQVTANHASGTNSFAAGALANANQDGCILFTYLHPGAGAGADCFGTQYQFRVMGDHGLSIDYATRLVCAQTECRVKILRYGTEVQLGRLALVPPLCDGDRINLAGGNGSRWAVIGDTVPGKTLATWTGAYLADGD